MMAFFVFIAFAFVVAVIPLAQRLARFVGLVDVPGGRKQHEDQVPLIGGLVIFISYFGVLFFSGRDFQEIGPFFVAVLLLLFVGALDDRFHIQPWIKFGAQFLATLVVVFIGDLQIHHLGNLFGLGVFELGFMSIPFSIAAVMLLINAINLMDGLDGLAGGVCFVILGWLMVACLMGGDLNGLFLIVPLAAALVGFLVYNLRTPFRAKASVFLGDAGAMALGLSLAWFVISLTQQDYPPLQPISVAWILAVPIMDECAQFYRRVREGRHPFSPDRGHFHHHFIDAGFSAGQATALIMVIVFVFGGLGYDLVYFGLAEVFLTCGWISLLLFHMFISEKPARLMPVLKWVREKL